jgi:competence protein ComEA
MKKLVSSAAVFVSALVFSAGLACAAEKPVAPKTTAVPAAEKKADIKPVAPATEELLDINTATEEQLKKIPGIGDEYSKKIVAGRPYAKKDQLKSRKIIPPAVYEKIKDKIIAKQAKADSKK